MINYRNLVISIFLPVFSACSTQVTQPVIKVDPVSIDNGLTVHPISSDSFPESDLHSSKSGKSLKLIRVMEGGACKNYLQGATAMFMLYANPEDISRINQTQGQAIFAEFEIQIQDFAMVSLQQAINQLDFKTEASGQNENFVQKQFIEKLINLFINLISDDIAQFEAETTLTIEVIPDPDTVAIFLNGCEIPHDH